MGGLWGNGVLSAEGFTSLDFGLGTAAALEDAWEGERQKQIDYNGPGRERVLPVGQTLDYPGCVERTPGLVSYWRLNDPTAPSVTSGPNMAGAGANDSSFGTTAWTNPGNVIADDASEANAVLSAASSQYLKTSSHGFTIPTGATIAGIKVEVERSIGGAGSGTLYDSRVRIVKGGTVGATDKASGTAWAGSAVVEYGGATDLWGETWTPADINAGNFGMAFSARHEGAIGSLNATIDFIRITVYYTTPKAEDIWGGLNGSYVGSPTLGVQGVLDSVPERDRAVALNGTSQYVTVPDVDALKFSGTQPYSYEAWIRPSALGGDRWIMGRGGWEYLYVNVNGALFFGYYGTDFRQAVSANGTIVAGSTYHVVGTFNGTVLKVYVNGVEVGTLTPGDNKAVPGSPPAIGYNTQYGTSWFAGVIDEAAIYGIALTAAQVREHYERGRSSYANAVLDSVPVSYWRLDETTGVAQDVMGRNDGTYGATVTRGATSLIGGDSATDKAANVPGNYLATGMVTVPDSASLDQVTPSLEAWVTIETNRTQIIVSKPNAYYLKQNAAGKGEFGVVIGGLYYVSESAASLGTGTYHLAGVHDGKTVTLYVNGVAQASVAAVGAVDATTDAFAIGGWADNEFDGIIDEVAIYPRALEPEEVQAHYRAGRNVYGRIVVADTPLAYWRMGDPVGATQAKDLMAGDRHTSVSANPPTFGTAGALADDPNTAATFDGINDFLAVPLDLSHTNRVSMEWWGWWDVNDTSVRAWFSFEWNVGPPYGGFVIFQGTGLEIAHRLGSGGSQQQRLFTQPSAAAWHHYVVVMDATRAAADEQTLYIDGAVQTPTSTPNSQEHAETDRFKNGTFYMMSIVAANYGLGRLDEVAIYDRALTAGQARSHYEAGRSKYAREVLVGS